MIKSIQVITVSLLGLFTLAGCSTSEGTTERQQTGTQEEADEAEVAALGLDEVTLSEEAPQATCKQNLAKVPNVAKLCAQIDALKQKYAGRDIVIAGIGAASNGALGAYVVYDYSDLKASRDLKQMPAPLEKKSYMSETASWGSYGVAGVGIYATDAGSPAVQGYAYGTAGYGPNGGFIVLKSDTSKGGKRSLIVPLVW